MLSMLLNGTQQGSRFGPQVAVVACLAINSIGLAIGDILGVSRLVDEPRGTSPGGDHFAFGCLDPTTTIHYLMPPETVVLIHGWFSHRWLMLPLANKLRQAGFETRVWGYRSLRKDIAAHAADFADYLESLRRDEGIERPHIVAHSMGSIVTRCVLTNYPHISVGRVVMLCPPNRGSHMARRASRIILGACKPLAQISDEDQSFVNQLPAAPLRAEVGIVVASGDRVVHPAATALPGAADSVEVPGMHNMVLFRRLSADHTIQFLRTGRF